MKKIIHLIPSLSQGGAERMLLKIIDNCNDPNVEHIVISASKCRPRDHVKYMNFASLFGFWSLLKLIKREKPDVIIGWLYLANLIVSILSIIYTVNNTKYYHNFRNVIDHTNPLNYKRKVFLGFIKLVTRAKNISCIYNSVTGLHSYNVYFKESNQNIVIPNGFDIVQKEPIYNESLSNIADSYDFIISFPARYDPAKDHDFFVHIVDKLITENPHLKIAAVLCGRGMLNDYSSKLEQLCIQNNNNFHFFESFDNLSYLYSISHLVLITSRTEAFPNVVGEAMINKCFVISSDVGDCAKILGRNDWIYPPGDGDSASNLLLNYLSLNNIEKANIINSNYERVKQNYSITSIIKKYNGL